ncbi:MAG: carboxymuconolactone decarboxylase family protein [Clostridiales Family XIII bacterium]|jgi:alkylhydroperoxidase family enzyme|nr:carboxymuconolactone decarboxylase family protein [Clostridiales Family XIII bacterium]
MLYDIENRLPYVKVEDMDAEQKKFYDYNIEVMQAMPYIWLLPDGTLNGPSNAFTHEAEIGNMFFPLNRKLMSQQRVPKTIQELCILVVVTSAKAAYGMYAHTMLARKFGLEEEKISSILAGQKPSGLTPEENAAYDLAWALSCQPGPLGGAVYENALKHFKKEGLAVLVFLIGNFKMVGTIINAYNEPVPEYRK